MSAIYYCVEPMSKWVVYNILGQTKLIHSLSSSQCEYCMWAEDHFSLFIYPRGTKTTCLYQLTLTLLDSRTAAVIGRLTIADWSDRKSSSKFCDGITLRRTIVLLAADTCTLAKDAIMQLSLTRIKWKMKVLEISHKSMRAGTINCESTLPGLKRQRSLM